MTTATAHPEIVERIALDIEASVMEWESGRMTSPSALDYVIDAGRRLYQMLPDFIGTTPEGREEVAAVLSEIEGEPGLQTSREIAAWLVDNLTAE